jgi:hypothetical protein
MTEITFKEYMEELGFTKKTMRELIFPDVPASTVFKWWEGSRNPPQVVYQTIKWYLRCVEAESRLERIVDMAGEGSGERDTME